MEKPNSDFTEKNSWLTTFLLKVCKKREDLVFWTVWLRNAKKAQKLGKSIITERKLPIDWLLEAVKYEEKSIPRLHNRVFKLTIIEKIDSSLDKSFIEDLKKDPKAWKEFEAMGEACYALVRVLLAVDRD